MNLNEYMQQGISLLVKTAGRFYLRNPRGIAFLAKIAPEIRKSAKRREQNEKDGLHVPPFLIASITSQCNLHCAGCYARASGACSDSAAEELSARDWEKIFSEAASLGTSFAILAGGEPLLRRDVVETAAQFSNMVFPVFTNGSMLDEDYRALFDRCRNLIPIFSMEGGPEATNERRGAGAYETVREAMSFFHRKRLLFGASVTVTKSNIAGVTDAGFVEKLRRDGCGVLFYVEYVPVEPGTEHLLLDDEDVRQMQAAANSLRGRFQDMVILSFPGDETETDGCLASGRGFFHINAAGGAEPCPFSPYSALSLKEHSMREALQSGFFHELRGLAAQAGHDGGCTLFRHRAEVEDILDAAK